jgi:hypothetical protein
MKKLKKCDFCTNSVPKKGQCNRCGFIDGLNRMPSPEEFEEATRINEVHEYGQYRNLDLLVEKEHMQ